MRGNKSARNQFREAQVIRLTEEMDMKPKNDDEITQEASSQETKQSQTVVGDGIDRRNFLECMAWAGTGLLWSMVGGVPASKLLAATGGSAAAKTQAVEEVFLRYALA